MLVADRSISLFLYYNIFFYKNQAYVMGIAVALRKSNKSTKKLHMAVPIGFTDKLRPYTDAALSFGSVKKVSNFKILVKKMQKGLTLEKFGACGPSSRR